MTLINLITRFYDTSRGSVEIDGIDIQSLRLEDLRSQIGFGRTAVVPIQWDHS